MKRVIPQIFIHQLVKAYLTLFIIFFAGTIYGASITNSTSGNWSATAWPNTTRTGSITTLTSSSNVTGSGTSFTTEISVGNIIKTSGNTTIGTVASITDNTHLVLTSNALSANTNISYKSQGVGPVDIITISSGSAITVDGIFTCASLTFAAVNANTTLTISGTNSLNVTGAVTMPRPSSGSTCTLSVGAGSLTAVSIAMNATTSGRNDVLTVSTGNVTISGDFTGGTTGCLVSFTGAGNFKIGGVLSATPSVTQYAGNTWNYYGSAQTVLGIAYNNLTLSGTGIKTLQTSTLTISNDFTLSGSVSVTAVAALTIGGKVTLGTGTTFIASAFTHNVAGNWTNNGIFTPGTGVINFDGTINQIIGGSGTNTFNSLTISNAAGLSLSGNVSVNTTLTFVSGKISTGAYSISIGNSAVVTGAGTGKYISGNLQMGIPASATTRTFDIGDATVYTPVTLNFAGSTNSAGSITLNTVAGNLPNISTSNINPALNVNRYWTITNNGVTGFSSYDAILNFVSGDIDAGADYTSFIAGEYSSSSWVYPVVGTTTSTSVQVTGMTSFGQFQLGESEVLSGNQYSGNGSTPAVSDVLPCINMPSDPLIISSSFAVHQYFTMNVIKGLTYEVYTCSSASPANPLMLTVYKEGAPTDPYIGFSTVNTGNPCSSLTNDVYVSFTPAYSGEVRVLVNRKGNPGSSSPIGLTIKANVVGGNNTLDDQTLAGSDKWIGHIYDGMAFNNYLGYYLTGSETFQESFGTSGTWPNNVNDDVTCFNFLSGGAVHASVLDITFSVRYRMNSTRKGLYTASMTSDDGSRLFVDNNSIYSNWSDHSPVTSANVLFNLTGSSSLAFEYYENGGQNVAGFTGLVQVLSNTLSQNVNQNIYLNATGLPISGDVFGTLPSGITLSGTGYQWAYSSTSSTGPWTNITGATSATFTPSTTTAPFNTAGTYYVIRNTSLSSTNNITPNPYVAVNQSNYAVIIVSPVAGTWLGITSNDWHTVSNWSGGVPLSATDVVVPSGTPFQPSINSASAYCHNLTINSGASLSISAGKLLTVSGTLVNNAGTAGLILQSDATGTASLLHNSDNISATVNLYITGSAENWHLLSSPVASQLISGAWLPAGTYGNGTGYDLYVWNEASSCWIYKLNITSTINWNTVHPSASFVPGRGYLYSVQASNPVKQFTGTLNNGNININLTSSGTNLSLTGFNLVGNPYPSTIDWQASTGWSRSGLVSNTGGYDMWIWNPAANNYGVINSSGGTGTNGVTRFIAPAQGFFVKAANNGILGLTNNIRIAGGNGAWMKSLSIDPSPLSIKVNSESGAGFDEVQLVFGSIDNESGTTKLFSPVTTAPSIFLPLKGENFTLRYLTDTVENTVVPMMFKPGSDGYYTIQFNNSDQFEHLVLEDRQLNTFQDIKVNNTYRFKSLKTDNPGRFYVHFKQTGKPVSKELTIPVYVAKNKLVVNLTQMTLETEIMVSDIMGRILIKSKLEGESIHELSIDSKPQLLIVYLRNQATTVCHKVMWLNS